ncbi:hypothetical protein C8R47DRAFT_1224150 [Mycena vitilis]|nr:hypothetical protein C8R47DRAFT_1224150 [Mycena vitilis]
MAMTPISMHSIVREQKERTAGSSAAQIEQFLGESASKITSLDSQTAALQSQIAALEEQVAARAELRDRERATIAALRYLIAPIRKLPVELLVEILLFSIHLTDSRHTKDAFKVAQVCSRWRRVAHSTPRLWTGRITVKLEKCTRGAAYGDELEAWLARSAPLSFAVSLNFYGEWDTLNLSVVDTVVNSSPRWSYLQLWSASPPLVSRIAECQFDSLEEIDIPQNCTLLPLSFSAPCLRKAAMPADPLTFGPMPWAKLTDVYLNGFFDETPTTSCLDILAQFSNLATATVGTNGWPALPPAREDIVTLSLISTGKGGEETYLMPFFAGLSAPALEDLTLDVEVRCPWVQAQFTAFQQRSPNITHLSLLSLVALRWDDLRAALLHAPSLTHLVLRTLKPSVNSGLLRALQHTEIAVPVVPLLHDLTLEGIWDESDLTPAIAARWWTDTELASRGVPPAVARWTRILIPPTLNTPLSLPFRQMMGVRLREGLRITQRWYD